MRLSQKLRGTFWNEILERSNYTTIDVVESNKHSSRGTCIENSPKGYDGLSANLVSQFI